MLTAQEKPLFFVQIYWNISYKTLGGIGDRAMNHAKNIMVSLFKCGYMF